MRRIVTITPALLISAVLSLVPIVVAPASAAGFRGNGMQTDFLYQKNGVAVAVNIPGCYISGPGINGTLVTSTDVDIDTPTSGFLMCSFTGNNPAPTAPVTHNNFRCGTVLHLAIGPRNTYTAYPDGTVILHCYYPAT